MSVNKKQLNWFDNFCARSRSKFVAAMPGSKVYVNLGNNPISADECLNLIKRNMKRKEPEKDDVLWKIPIILISLGCLLVIIMAFSFVLQCLVRKLKTSKIVQRFW